MGTQDEDILGLSIYDIWIRHCREIFLLWANEERSLLQNLRHEVSSEQLWHWWLSDTGESCEAQHFLLQSHVTKQNTLGILPPNRLFILTKIVRTVNFPSSLFNPEVIAFISRVLISYCRDSNWFSLFSSLTFLAEAICLVAWACADIRQASLQRIITLAEKWPVSQTSTFLRPDLYLEVICNHHWENWCL